MEDRRLLSISAEPQVFAYLLNEVRHDPAGYAARTGLLADLSDVEPSPPLAVNHSLFASSQFHSQDMAENDFLEHANSQTGDMPNKVARDHGYALPVDWLDAANNIQVIAAADFLSNAELTLEEFIEDVDHAGGEVRNFLLSHGGSNTLGKEIGIGHGLNEATERKHFWAVQIAYHDTRDRFVTGVVYADANGNGRFDLNEGLPEVSVAAGTYSTTTNAAGGYSIKVPDGDYLVSASGGGFQGAARGLVTVLGENIEVDFVSGRSRPTVDFEPYQNRTPLAADDTVAVTEDGSVLAEVLANDADSDGTLAAGSVTITQSPARGTAQVDAATGTIRYVPDRGFFGSDFLAYTVHDDEGAASNEATVSIIVQPLPPSPWQNPVNSMDVDDSGAVVPLDVLLIINVLNSRGVIELPHTPGEVPEPPPYFDPSGDYVVSALDVLVIINYLNANWSGEGEGAWEQAADAAAASAEMAAIVAVSPAQTTVVAIHHRQSREASADNLFAQLATPTPRVPNPKARSSASWEPMVADKLLGLDLDLLGPSS